MAVSREDYKRVFRELTPFMIASGIGELASGFVLRQFLDFLVVVPGLFLLMPALMDMRGAVESALAARLGTAYHIGILNVRGKFFSRPVRENFEGAIMLALVFSALAAILAFSSATLIGAKHIHLVSYLLLAVLAGVIGAVIMGFITVFLTFASARRGIDPNHSVIPALTTIGDVGMVLIVYALVILLGGVLR